MDPTESKRGGCPLQIVWFYSTFPQYNPLDPMDPTESKRGGCPLQIVRFYSTFPQYNPLDPMDPTESKRGGCPLQIQWILQNLKGCKILLHFPPGQSIGMYGTVGIESYNLNVCQILLDSVGSYRIQWIVWCSWHRILQSEYMLDSIRFCWILQNLKEVVAPFRL